MIRFPLVISSMAAKNHPWPKDVRFGDHFCHENPMNPLWLFNIAMENAPFIEGKHDDLPIQNGDFP